MHENTIKPKGEIELAERAAEQLFRQGTRRTTRTTSLSAWNLPRRRPGGWASYLKNFQDR